MKVDRVLLSLFLVLFCFGIQAQQQGLSVDDSVEEDVFFDEMPDGGVDFIDELPTDESPETLYDGKRRSKAKRLNDDVQDRGPIELRQTPKGPSKKRLVTPDLLKDDPLFSIEKERPIKPDTPTEESQPKQAGEDKFQFPDAVEKGAPTGPNDPNPLKSNVKTPTVPVITPEFDAFGKPIKSTPPVAKPKAPFLDDETPSIFDEEPPVVVDGKPKEKLVYDDIDAPVRPEIPPSPSTVPFDNVEVLYRNRHAKEMKIKHPAAEKGLVRITQDRTYVYRVPKSEQKRAFSFRLGMFDPQYLENPDTGATFENLYDSTEGPIVFAEYEWQWIRSSFGKLGLKVGSGLFVAEGSGSFKNNYAENGSKNIPLEKFTFVAFPNSVAAVYRAQFYDNQPFVPYADGGLMAITFAEFRDDKDAPRLGLGTAGFFSAGGALNIGLLDTLSLINLDREYGINSIFLTGEFRQVVQLGGKFNFESSTVTGGVLMEF